MTSELTHEQRLARTGITVPEALPAFGQYVPAVQHGTTLWVGGHFGTRPDGPPTSDGAGTTSPPPMHATQPDPPPSTSWRRCARPSDRSTGSS